MRLKSFKSIMTWQPIIIVFALFMMNGCSSVGPDYSPPQMTLPEQWHSETANPEKPDPQVLAKWWEALEDPLLTRLIQQAVEHNPDIQQALSRVREARYQRIKTRSSLFPSLDATGAFRKSGSSDTDTTSELYSAGLDAGWELDIFGKNRRAAEAANADLEAQIEDYHDVMVTLLAETALNYIELRTLQSRLSVTLSNVETQKETWDLLNALSEAGRADELAVAQARYNLESSRAKIPDLNAQIEAVMNHLAVLTGAYAGALHEDLSSPKSMPQISKDLAVGIPADIVRQRPDIRQAERALAAQTALTGEAMAQQYPNFSLSGSIGVQALSADKLISSPTRIWSFGPSLSLPLFNANAVGSNIKINEERQNQALIQYKATVLNAMEEVEKALTDYAKDHQKLEVLQIAADAARLAAELAQYQYTTGLTDFSDVLDAQRSLLSFEDQVVEIRGTLLSDVVGLYKALGGGWQYTTPVADDHQTKGNKEEQ